MQFGLCLQGAYRFAKEITLVRKIPKIFMEEVINSDRTSLLEGEGAPHCILESGEVPRGPGFGGGGVVGGVDEPRGVRQARKGQLRLCWGGKCNAKEMQFFPADFGKPWKVSEQVRRVIAYKMTLNITLMESSTSAVQEAATMARVPWGEIHIYVCVRTPSLSL